MTVWHKTIKPSSLYNQIVRTSNVDFTRLAQISKFSRFDTLRIENSPDTILEHCFLLQT